MEYRENMSVDENRIIYLSKPGEASIKKELKFREDVGTNVAPIISHQG